jgi:hypothetical protein
MSKTPPSTPRRTDIASRVIIGAPTLTWLFEPAPAGSIVTVTAENVPSGISKADHDAGLKSSLDHLADVVERQT